MTFDFGPLVPADVPAPAAKWKGPARYHFIGGNNDPDGVPVADLTAAAHAVRARDARIKASFDDIMLVSGSLQAIDLVNGALLGRGDTIICERDCYEGTLNRYKRLGVNVVAIPLDQDGMKVDALDPKDMPVSREEQLRGGDVDVFRVPCQIGCGDL
ncbi:MAG: hypothetical protein P8Z80_00640 [Pseudolabrys sp.]